MSLVGSIVSTMRSLTDGHESNVTAGLDFFYIEYYKLRSPLPLALLRCSVKKIIDGLEREWEKIRTEEEKSCF